jgi:hypothetical protein
MGHGVGSGIAGAVDVVVYSGATYLHASSRLSGLGVIYFGSIRIGHEKGEKA